MIDTATEEAEPEAGIRPFYHEAQVEIGGGDVLHLVLDFRAIDIIEHLTKSSMEEVLPQLAKPPHNLVTKMLWAMLREYHSSMSLNDAMGIVVDRKYGPKVGHEIADILNRAYDFSKAKGQNPPKRRGR